MQSAVRLGELLRGMPPEKALFGFLSRLPSAVTRRLFLRETGAAFFRKEEGGGLCFAEAARRTFGAASVLSVQAPEEERFGSLT